MQFRLILTLLLCTIICYSCANKHSTTDTNTSDVIEDQLNIDTNSEETTHEVDTIDAVEIDSSTDSFYYEICPGADVFASSTECYHPPVEDNCDIGWCYIQSGCFLLGSPTSEPVRGAYSETLTQVTLTHSFEIKDHETTQGEWVAMGFDNPSIYGPNGNNMCSDPSCPVENITWYEALMYVNKLSESNIPPLNSCYQLGECTGEVGQGMTCSDVIISASSIYECEGYRLPTVAEIEYATKAGTISTYYSGPIYMGTDPFDCLDADPCLLPVAWYCFNSEDTSHMVKQLIPNEWGLYDMLGNVAEWTNDKYNGLGYGGEPIVDPEGPDGDDININIRGGCLRCTSFLCRSAANFSLPASERNELIGLRVVRTVH